MAFDNEVRFLPALANDHLVTSKRLEGRRAVSGDHLVTLLVTTVLLLVVKVVAARFTVDVRMTSYTFEG